MKVKIKLTQERSKLPEYANPGDAGMDLYAAFSTGDSLGNWIYNCGVSVEIPEGYVGLVFPRSSISKTGHTLRNSVGVIDSGYRGEIILKFSGDSNKPTYKTGDKVGQLVILPYPQIEWEVVEDLSTTERGTGGFGSTGQ